jgi:hypothetical protein
MACRSAAVAPFCEMMKARDAEIRKMLEVEWEKVPVLPDVPKDEPAPDEAK